MDKVATDVAIKRFGVNIASICNCCFNNHSEESTNHLLSDSHIANLVWSFSCNSCDIILVKGQTRFTDLQLQHLWQDTYSRIEKLSPAIHCQIVYWQKPHVGWVKLNVDGCSKGNPSPAGGGGLIRDHHGILIEAFAEFYRDCSCNIAEAKAMMRGIKMCISKGFTNVIVESDSLILLNLIKRIRNPPWRFTDTIE
ncbi:uncharacterized protein LOC107768948 [Nicotiana tabacum]|uniref:Uncharacterized protein LOC107768948 n=2 Tax=Nicotiana TaxID=4085 RepID=A0A1S3XV93_TOBAC|nr:PREDICTED: uncharacterized protein LOC104224244 [Nicotiana sylvestris]XP_016443612.1 PREDICTED: uncharacterized protein LOC107768948 [Nicotiana tabacum]